MIQDNYFYKVEVVGVGMEDRDKKNVLIYNADKIQFCHVFGLQKKLFEAGISFELREGFTDEGVVLEINGERIKGVRVIQDYVKNYRK